MAHHVGLQTGGQLSISHCCCSSESGASTASSANAMSLMSTTRTLNFALSQDKLNISSVLCASRRHRFRLKSEQRFSITVMPNKVGASKKPCFTRPRILKLVNKSCQIVRHLSYPHETTGQSCGVSEDNRSCRVF